jgi:hypothetical protein
VPQIVQLNVGEDLLMPLVALHCAMQQDLILFLAFVGWFFA